MYADKLIILEQIFKDYNLQNLVNWLLCLLYIRQCKMLSTWIDYQNALAKYKSRANCS